MPGIEIELNPVDFITVGTIGPKGQRIFYLQAGRQSQLASLVIEKEQTLALSEAIREFLTDVETRFQQSTPENHDEMDMQLREPIEPLFRVAQMGLGYDDKQDRIVLIVQELIISDEDLPADTADAAEIDIPDTESLPEIPPSVVRMWCTRKQIRALGQQAMAMVESGRADPRQNGRITYYWM